MSTDRTVRRVVPLAVALAGALAASPALSRADRSGPAASDVPPPDGPAPADVVGGAWYTCPAMGIVFGLQVASGDVVGSFSTLLAADRVGCI